MEVFAGISARLSKELRKIQITNIVATAIMTSPNFNPSPPLKIEHSDVFSVQL
jgi:hypothetical protein